MPNPHSDPWAQYFDWNKVPLSDALRQGASNLPASAGRDVWSMVTPFFPSNWSQTAHNAKMLARGLASKGEGALGYQNPTKSADETAVDAVRDYYRSRYGTAAGFKEGLATDPAGILFDTSALLSLPAGGEGLAARLPGALGKAAQVAARAARIGAEATNPVAMAGKAVSVGSRAAINAARPIVNANGSLTPAVLGAVKRAFPNGLIGEAELSDPKFQAVLKSTLQAKGVTPEAVRQAVLNYHDAPAPRSVVTSRAPPQAAAGRAQALTQQARTAVGGAAANLAGAQAPSDVDLGLALERSQIAARNGYGALYKQAFSHEGQFVPEFADTLPESLSGALAAKDLPTNPAEFAKYPSLAGSANTHDWLTAHVHDLAQNNQLTLPNLERARQELVRTARAASSTDKAAVGAMIEGLDSHIQNAAQLPHMMPWGDAPAIASDLSAARDAYRAYQENFHNGARDPALTPIATAVKGLKASQTIDEAGQIVAPAGEEAAKAAQGAIARKLISPSTLEAPPSGDKLYARLGDLLDPDGRQALDNYIRQTALATDANGQLVVKPERLSKFLSTPMASQVFSPDEMMQGRLAAAANDVLATRPGGALDVTLGEHAGHVGRTVLGGALGAAASKAMGAPGEMGAIGGAAAEGIGEVIRGAVQRRAESAGAKPDLGALRNVETVGKAAQALAAPLPAANVASEVRDAASDSEQPAVTVPPEAATADPWAQYVTPDDRPARATGGRVDNARRDEIVGKLLKAAEAAKRTGNAATKPMLAVPDDAVAKALAVAQATI